MAEGPRDLVWFCTPLQRKRFFLGQEKGRFALCIRALGPLFCPRQETIFNGRFKIVMGIEHLRFGDGVSSEGNRALYALVVVFF